MKVYHRTSSIARAHSASGRAEYERMTEPMAVKAHGQRAKFLKWPHEFRDTPEGRCCRVCGANVKDAPGWDHCKAKEVAL